MPNIFNIALQINKQDISISLVKNSKRSPKLNLGGTDYAINYTGPIEYFETFSRELEDYFKSPTISVTKESLEACLQTRFRTVGYNQFLMLPDGAPIPSNIPKDAILIKMAGHQVNTYKMMGDQVVIDNSIDLSQDQIRLAEISTYFPRSGEISRPIKEYDNRELFDKIALACGYTPVVAISTTQDKIQRAKNLASVITAGLSETKSSEDKEVKESKDLARPHGRMVMKDYYAEIQKNQAGLTLPIQQRLLSSQWKLDKTTKLSLPEWEAFKRQQWKDSHSNKQFLAWLTHQSWINSKSKDDFFTWHLRNQHKEFGIPISFNKWKSHVLMDIDRNRRILGKDATIEDAIMFSMEHFSAGGNLSPEQYFKFKQWEQLESKEHFEDWIWRKQWEGLPPPNEGEVKESFDTWKNSKLKELEERWEKSGMRRAGLSFPEWRREQDDTQLTDTGFREFIRCDDSSRRHYQLTVTPDGMSRNSVPYSTEYESTLHSGKGYAIFVIGSNQEIYAGSHIGSIFHHSSFFGDSAVLAAGELRTGLACSFQPVKNEKEKLEAIKKFQTDNKDPYNLHFIQNESKKSWTLVGEDSSGKMRSLTIESDSELGKALKNANARSLSFSKRTELLDKAAELLGRRNNKDQITLLSSKSGHYHPEDEENYYMLKLWEKRGVDLAKTPFTCFMGFGIGAQTFRSAQEYIAKVEPAIRARQEAQLSIGDEGIVRNRNLQPITSIQTSIVLNKKGEIYSGDDYKVSFTHPKMISTKGDLPGFEKQKEVLKTDIEIEIKKLKDKKSTIQARINNLDDLIKHGTKRKRDSRRTIKESELLRISEIDKKITKLEDAIKSAPRLAKQEILGGGVITTNSNGLIIKIDAKLGDYNLSDKEIKNTLKKLENQGVKLDIVELITYNKLGEQNPSQNAAQYLLASKSSVTPIAPRFQTIETAREFDFHKKASTKTFVSPLHERKGAEQKHKKTRWQPTLWKIEEKHTEKGLDEKSHSNPANTSERRRKLI